MRNATHTMRNGELSILLYSVACRLLIFCEKTPQKPMRKQNASSIPGQQSAKARVSAHAGKEITPPRAAADARAANNNNNTNTNNTSSSSSTTTTARTTTTTALQMVTLHKTEQRGRKAASTLEPQGPAPTIKVWGIDLRQALGCSLSLSLHRTLVGSSKVCHCTLPSFGKISCPGSCMTPPTESK